MENPTKNMLATILQTKAEEVLTRQTHRPLVTLQEQVTPLADPGFLTALRLPNNHAKAFVFELKPASPSQGVMQEHLPLESYLDVYNVYGDAISVLTDTTYFQGSLELLASVSQASHRPTLCKDFVLEEYQVYEARLARASAVLLIVKALDHHRLKSLYQCITNLGMTPVVEVQTEAEVEQALQLDPAVILINHRNLETLTLDLSTTERLAPLIPQDVFVLAASGIQTAMDLEKIAPHADGFLIGSQLMKTPLAELGTLLAQWSETVASAPARRSLL